MLRELFKKNVDACILKRIKCSGDVQIGKKVFIYDEYSSEPLKVLKVHAIFEDYLVYLMYGNSEYKAYFDTDRVYKYDGKIDKLLKDSKERYLNEVKSIIKSGEALGVKLYEAERLSKDECNKIIKKVKRMVYKEVVRMMK